MRRILQIILFQCIIFPLIGQDYTFMGRFNAAKGYLSEGKTTKAIPLLQDLLKMEPSNSNLHYLLGVCYTEADEITNQSIYHLEKSVKDVATDYDPSSYSEKRTPVFVYYFLTVAYSQNGLCIKAKEASFQFAAVYGNSGKADFYMDDAKRWVAKCKAREAEAPPPVVLTIKPEVVTASKVEYSEKIQIKKIEYTTQSALFGVQVAAVSRLVPVYEFRNLRNIEAFLDHNGMVRYVVGHFSFRKQAETLLEQVRAAGYPDAFIVDVNQEKKFEDEIISVDNRSFKKRYHGWEKLDYRVQIGAFRDSIPSELAQKYLEVEGIEETIQEGLTMLTTGHFETYKEATAHRDKMLGLGIPGAFIVAFLNDKRVPVVKD